MPDHDEASHRGPVRCNDASQGACPSAISGNKPRGICVVSCQEKQESFVSLDSRYPQLGSRRCPLAGGGSLGDADASEARAKTVGK